MNVKQVKETMQTWVADNAHQYPGLQFAHLVGSITPMADDTPFPLEKDVDLHLVFAPGSPALAPNGPYSSNLEFLHEGLMVEVGLKPVSEYQDTETILANPEIAHHLTLDSILYDPQGTLAAMMPQVKEEYNHRRWVQARIEHERRGWEFTAELYNQLPEKAVSTRVNLMGYAFTRLSAVLCDVTLQAPTISFAKMREILTEYGRSDIYQSHLALFGLDRATPELAQQFFQKACEAFDLAVQIRKTPHPFQHKLHAHLRPYFTGKYQRLFDAGYTTDAMAILLPFYISSLDVIVADGTPSQKAHYEQQRCNLLQALGIDSIEIQQARWAESRKIGRAIFALAYKIANTNPDIKDR